MSNRMVIEHLLTDIATSREQGWEWIIALHDGGYQLQMGQFMPFFANVYQTEFIQPELSLGTVVWTAGAGSRTGSPKFPDPVVAMAWWGVERSNRQAENGGWDDVIPKAPQPAQMVIPPQQPWVGRGLTPVQPVVAGAPATPKDPFV